MPVLFLLGGPKMVFCSAGATRCPDKREIWHGDCSPCQISRLSEQKCGNTAPKIVKISKFSHKFVPQGRLICSIFTKFSSIFQCLYVAFKFLVWSLLGDKQPSYKHFPSVGEFSHKFSIAPNGKITDQIKKLGGCKNGTDLLYHRAKYGGDRGSRAGCIDKKV